METNLIWGQQTIERCRYFKQRYGQWHDIALNMLPHYQFVNGNQRPYRDYIAESWQTNDKNIINSQCEKFTKLINDIRLNGCDKPVILCGNIIVDGNHRLSICDNLNMAYKSEQLTLKQWVDFHSTGGARYARNDSGFYQSFYIGSEFFRGRRSNEVWQFINQQDIEGKTVLDLGCNIGANSYFARYNEAKNVLGLDYDINLINFALKLNCFNHYDNIEFEQYDLNNEYRHECDTIFCFSVDYHIQNKKALLSTLKQANVVYFETHETGESELIKEFHAEHLGNTDNGIHSTERNRKVYRLTKNLMI